MKNSRIHSRDVAALIEEILHRSLGTDRPAEMRISGTVSMETGVGFCHRLIGSVPAREFLPPPARVVDGAGHSRPVYKSLLVYACARAAQSEHSKIELIPWCDLLETELRRPDGLSSVLAGWNALALLVAAEQLDRADRRGLAKDTFDRLVRQQQPDGSLLPPTPAANPESRWYDELVLLHALGTYSVEARDASAAAAVRRAAEFHLMETEPDHATQQPWALFAFLSSPMASIGADQILHGCLMRTRILDAVSLILLADALWCIRQSGEREIA